MCEEDEEEELATLPMLVDGGAGAPSTDQDKRNEEEVKVCFFLNAPS